MRIRLSCRCHTRTSRIALAPSLALMETKLNWHGTKISNEDDIISEFSNEKANELEPYKDHLGASIGFLQSCSPETSLSVRPTTSRGTASKGWIMHYFDSTGFFRRPSSYYQFATQTKFGNRFKKLWSGSRGLSTPPPGSPPSTSASTLSFPFTSRRAVVVHLLLDLRARWKTCPLQYMVAWLHVGNPDRSLYVQEWKKSRR